MKKIWFYTFMLLTLGLAACQDTDKLEADLGSLGNRVAALENKVEMLNGNIKALNILCQDGMIISKVEYNEADGVYSITLSDGTMVKLMEKIAGFGIAPLVSINADGNWQVSYDNGVTYQPILKGNAPVNAVGKDGVTPKFRVGAGDYWEVSTDGGATYVQVKDTNNQPVKAVYDPQTNPHQQFTSVVKTDDYLEVTLSGGETVRVPIVADFFCYFDKSITGEQKINPGETKTYNVHIKGAESTVVTTPMGWKATLGAPTSDVAVLTVIAPAAAAPTSRATADNLRDISILAFKGTFATLTKIQVNPIEVGGGAVTPPTPSGPVTELVVPLTAATTFTNIGKYSKDTQLTSNGWFQRDADTPITALSLDASIPAFKAVVTGTKGTWNNSSFGYHSTATFEWKAKYKLTFQVQTDIVGSVGVALRTAADDRGFRMIKADGVSNWERSVTTPATTTSWSEVAVIFDLGWASTAMSSTAVTYNAGETTTTEDDVKGINIYLYNNQPNSTLYIKDIKLVKQ